MNDDFRLVVWGARGSRQVCDPDTQCYGGDTSCFEIRAGDYSVMVDCGSGAQRLECDLLKRGVQDIDLMLTHTHLDHLIGMPFFRLNYLEGYEVRVHIGHLEKWVRGDKPFQALFDPQLFPVPVKQLKAMRIHRFFAPDRKTIGPFEVSSVRLNHPGGAVGYRFDHRGKSIAIITDHEHGNADRDRAVIDFCRDVDLMLIDTMFTEAEYVSKAGWGHATPEAGVAIARAANVGKILLSHHAPWRTDAQLDEIVGGLRDVFPSVEAAAAGRSYIV